MAKRRYKNLFRNKDGKWCVDFTAKKEFGGKRIIRVFKSFSDAEAALPKLREEIIKEAGAGRTHEKITFSAYAERFMEKYSRIEKRSWRRDEVSLVPLKRYLGARLIQDIRLADVAEYKADRKSKPKANGKPLAVATINREIALLKKMFNVAVDWGYLEYNPILKAKIEKENNRRERYLTDEEMSRLVDAASDHLRPILIVALSTGMRRGEILSLRWADVHVRENYIHIEKTKSGKPRNVPLNRRIIEALAGLSRESEFVFYNPETDNHIQDVKRTFKSCCDKAKIKNLHFHDLRHSAASAMIRKGIDIVTVKEILGHADINMTMRYVHPAPEDKCRAVEVMGNILGPGRKNDERNDDIAAAGTTLSNSLSWN